MERKQELVRNLVETQMALANAEKVEVILLDGSRQIGEMCMSFDCEETQFQYFIFTLGERDKENRMVVYAARYDVVNSPLRRVGFELTNVMSAEEVEMIQDVLKKKTSKGIFRKKQMTVLHTGGIVSMEVII